MWFFGLVVVVLVGAVAVVASGRWGQMSTAYDDRPDASVPARQVLSSDDIARTRFGVGLRGYRMDEVDTLLERLAREVAERDRRIADLERAVTPILHGPEGAGFTSRSEYDLTDFDDTGYQKPILVGGDFPATDASAEPAAAEAAAGEPAAAEPVAAEEHAVTAAPEPVVPVEHAVGDDAQPTREDQAAAPRSEALAPGEYAAAEAGEYPPTRDQLVAEPTGASEAQLPESGTAQPSESGDAAQVAGTAVDETPRGRHSAAPDVNVAQRPGG
ncbi:hypothetical protein Kfla_5507 [Kribbella flavida DSM 17836]|uniref:DivIVA domain protein n=1 Tax=Kribbella flavida (strain DSM 17836 / JCM 10339 / NBRC 14399) TaxID=479435 RepID=D2PN33_KRIFD|nr:DivIVA domain-containing protein [Kribbella flavida]ADB34517.1 hypothetical protein Kfla_5507 [Kribbella flavida DSM 17836]